MKGKTEFAADSFHALGVSLQPSLIFRTHRRGIDVKILFAFDVLEKRRGGEIKRQFVRIKNLKDHHFMSGGGESAKIALQFVHRREQIGDQHDQSAFACQFRHAAQWFAEIGFASFGFPFQRQHQLAQMPVPMPRGQIILNAVGKGEQAHRIALFIQKPGERCRQGAGIVRLGIGERAVVHRTALIH